MIDNAWTVVKVGGSLFDWSELRARLGAFLDHLRASPVLIVPGGGATADAIRRLDQTHVLGADAAHWLAIGALSVNARFLQTLMPGTPLLASPCQASGTWILDAMPFFQEDEARLDRLPHCWEVTSDSLAVRAACLLEAHELILLKSMTWQGHDWTEASRAGVVDRYFSEALRQTPRLRVRLINLRG